MFYDVITGSQEKKLEGSKVHSQGWSCFHALLWSRKGKCWLFFNTLVFFVFLTLASASFLTQTGDPLGSIHLRGSVVTAVEHVPDGEWGCCHRIQILCSTSLLCQTVTRKCSRTLLSAVAQPIPCNVFPLFQAKNMMLMKTSLRLSPLMRLTTSSKLLQPRRGWTGSMQYRQHQKLGNKNICLQTLLGAVGPPDCKILHMKCLHLCLK